METMHTIKWNPSGIDQKKFFDELLNFSSAWKNKITIETEKEDIAIDDLEFYNFIETESGEEHRAYRLNEIVSKYKDYCKAGSLCSFDKLASLLDHKGGLMVSWISEPTEVEKYIIANIWEIYGNELSRNVEHYLLTPVKL